MASSRFAITSDLLWSGIITTRVEVVMTSRYVGIRVSTLGWAVVVDQRVYRFEDVVVGERSAEDVGVVKSVYRLAD
jgi:hypothetical protein